MAAVANQAVSVKQPRAYQLELFEASMKRNVIVTMDTGSGKTHVAKLRIEAELERCSPEKLVWFLAPTVVLAEQQHKYLTDQLPAYQSRLICGSDNVEHWSTSSIWNAVLRNVRIVVSTSRILLDALVHGFVQMGRIALLVFDEAHHCMKNHDINRVMLEFYHKASPGDVRPHILGLSASPITNAKPGALEKLEQNLNAICKAPTRHLEELQQYVHQPEMCKLAYMDAPVPASRSMQKLEQLIEGFNFSEDPLVGYLTKDGRAESQNRLQKVIIAGSTNSLKQLKDLHRRTTELHQQLGQWASTYFLDACVEKLREKVARCSSMVSSLQTEEEVFLHQKLSKIVGEKASRSCSEVEDFGLSPKALCLLKYLEAEYTKEVTGILFVKERSTAAILANLISQHPITKNYSAEPFVGSSNFARKARLIDLADIKAQNVALADFRLRKNNLLVCTSVMEEGVDISSMNLVIRFDEPANFRAFIQSRGRARMVESKFVLMCGDNDPAGSYSKWRALEAEMKSKYMDEMRQIARQAEDEELNEGCDEFLFDSTTGARLNIHDAKGHLEHFCACLPTVPYADVPRPEYLYTLEHPSAGEFRADVVLPQSVNIHPRRTSGRFLWKTQTMAAKEAAFRAYTRLYDAGLINKNLLPTALPETVVVEDNVEAEEEVESVVCVRERLNPWIRCLDTEGSKSPQVLTIYAQFSEEKDLPPLHILVPNRLDLTMDFQMLWTREQPIKVKVHPEKLVDGLLDDRNCHLSAQRLLQSVFGNDSSSALSSSFLVVPFLEVTCLQKWLTECTSDSFARSLDGLRPEWGLIRLKSWTRGVRPYIFRSKGLRLRDSDRIHDSTLLPRPATEEIHFEVKRLPKRLDYLHPPNSEDWNTAIEFVPAADCVVDQFPTKYAKVMILLPSVLHRIEIRIVAMSLSQELLSLVNFRNIELVEEAICASAANEGSNYQRLELIGDSILKFWTSAQLCAQFPGWHEGYLSDAKHKIVSNAHLCRAARAQGLDEYIHTQPFAGHRWRPPIIWPMTGDMPGSLQRDMSKKVLADVIEALIGASFLDGEDGGEEHGKVKACLNTFLTSVSWNSPTENASHLQNLVPSGSQAFDNFGPLTEVTGYRFRKIILLIEALTHPSHPPIGIHGSYQRLEFLGDSILDFLVVEEMARRSVDIPHFKMHLIRAAVVNAHLLAFFCLGAGLEQQRSEITTDRASGAVKINTTGKKTYLWEFMKHSGKVELLQAQNACVKRYQELNASLQRALRIGRSHPWHLLLSFNAPKFFSDIIESILGAIFIDSKGDLKACKGFLEGIGLLRYLRRAMTGNVDMMHPKERLGTVAGNRKIRYVLADKKVDGAVFYSSTVFVDDEAIAISTGEISRAAAETKAAENTIESLVKRRDRSVVNGDEQMTE